MNDDESVEKRRLLEDNVCLQSCVSCAVNRVTWHLVKRDVLHLLVSRVFQEMPSSHSMWKWLACLEKRSSSLN